MNKLPENVQAYKKTKTFNENDIPHGLLNNHNTRKGVWGIINIVSGNLLYTIDSDPSEEVELNINYFGVVEPEVIHKVQPIGKVEFYVEFYK
jgi:tellurite resistance-related uncharacterized protein